MWHEKYLLKINLMYNNSRPHPSSFPNSIFSYSYPIGCASLSFN